MSKRFPGVTCSWCKKSVALNKKDASDELATIVWHEISTWKRDGTCKGSFTRPSPGERMTIKP